MTPAAVATALRVLATAVADGRVVDRPSAVEVYGRHLQPSEVQWLCAGMADAQLVSIPAPTGAEDMQLFGTLLGRVVRVLLIGRLQAGLIGDLSQTLADRTRRQVPRRAKAGAQ